MCTVECGLIMRSLIALALVAMLATSVLATGGVNELADVEGTDIAYVSHASLVQEGGVFDMYLTVIPGSNVSSVQWITQICINTGVCYPPETNEMVSVDSDTYTTTVDIDDTAAYINWKFVLHSEDGYETSVPETGFGWKVWSDCWFDNATWGGDSYVGISGLCEPEDLGGLPGFAAPLATLALAMAALIARRD